MICSKCAISITSYDNFCGNCGHKLNESNNDAGRNALNTTNKIPPELACPKCCATISTYDNFCKICGHRLERQNKDKIGREMVNNTHKSEITNNKIDKERKINTTRNRDSASAHDKGATRSTINPNEVIIGYKCPICNTGNTNNTKYCIKCGHWLLDTQKSYEAEPITKKLRKENQNKTNFLSIIFVVSLALFIVAIFIAAVS